MRWSRIGGVDTRTQHAMVASSYLITVVLLGLAPALWTDPTATGCVDCSRNLWLIANRPERATTLAEWGFRAATGGRRQRPASWCGG